MASQERKWIGVRLSRLMMEQIEDLVNEFPEWAWANPNDFVRDAVRRHMEYVRQQGSLRRTNTREVVTKAKRVIRQIVDEENMERVESEFDALCERVDPAREPTRFVEELQPLLAGIMGQRLAAAISERIKRELM